MDSLRKAAILLLICALSTGFAGCNDKFFDPSQIGRFRPVPAVNVILNSLGVAEESPVAWENAEDPQPRDIAAVKTDYALRPGDLVRIAIFELLQEGATLVNDYVVSESGKVSVPDVGIIPAAGLSETQLEDQIKRILSPSKLRDPSVTVTLLDSQQRTFSILGNAVARPSRYLIPRYDFRLTDALATAGAQMQFNVSNVYVSRREDTVTEPADVTAAAFPGSGAAPSSLTAQKPASELGRMKPGSPWQPQASGPKPQATGPNPPWGGRIPSPSQPAQKFESEREMLDLIAPHAGSAWPQSKKVIETPPARSDESDVMASSMSGGFRWLVPPEATQSGQAAQSLPWRGRPALASRGHPGLALSGNGSSISGGMQGQDALATGGQGQDALATRIPQVLAPVEFGAPAGSEPPAVESKSKERVEWIFREADGKWVPVIVSGNGSSKPAAMAAGPSGGIEWMLKEGRWVPVQKEEPQAAQSRQPTQPPSAGRLEPAPARTGVPPAGSERLPMDLEWEQAIQTRLIRIPADKLLAGDPRYNIVIKPGDTIHVPVDVIGEFAIIGNVNRSGYIDITGRPMTLKMAIAAAGGLGPLAWPKNVEVIRRIGTSREEIVLVDLDRIASGEQPDFFIKPNDLINVGTHPTSRWRAVLRNAFRAVYGFGFVYDRNFADADYGTGFPHWF